MKTNALVFSLASLSLSFTVLPARAASPTEETEPVQLPVYVVNAERLSDAEKTIERSLQQLRALAAKPITVERPVPFFMAKTTGNLQEKKAPGVIVAGL
jgi:hypothetical protein